MTGADMIRLLLESVVEKLAPISATIPDVIKNLDSMKSQLDDLNDTNSFMVMAINRFQDVAKASSGMALLPRSELTNILTALSLPLKCMTNAHSEIPIKLSSLPENMYPHIITDKQWVQENLFCLLSNAVKYSHAGPVQVNVRLMNTSPSPASVEFPTPRCKSFTPFGSQPSYDSFSTQVASWTIEDGTKAPSIMPALAQLAIPSLSFQLSASEMVRIEVVDSGIGISEEKMAMLFQPFQQSQRMAGGTGLGLYSLAKRMDALRGEYGVHKRTDGKQGSVFWFSFPYRPDKSEALNLEDPSQPDISSIKSGNVSPSSDFAVSPRSREGLRRMVSFLNTAPASLWNVLVVDDTPSIAKMTKTVLSRRGHTVTTAVNGAAAVQVMESMLSANGEDDTPPFDLILIDLQMPVMDGLEATRRIRLLETNSHRRSVIVGTSADCDPETLEQLRVGGFDAFIEKPFQLEIFENIVAQLMKQCDASTDSVSTVTC